MPQYPRWIGYEEMDKIMNGYRIWAYIFWRVRGRGAEEAEDQCSASAPAAEVRESVAQGDLGVTLAPPSHRLFC